MKTLFLLRHAKANRADERLDDHARTLSSRGLQDAMAMAEAISVGGSIPELVLCSSSRRTRETLALVMPYLSPAPEILLQDDLYLASSGTLMRIVSTVDPSLGRIMVVGHNDGLHEFAASLAGSGDPALRQRLRERFPPGSLARLGFPTDQWRDVAPGLGRLDAYLTPRDLICET